MPPNPVNTSISPSIISPLLQEFSVLSQEPNGLPRVRSTSHHIHLTSSANLVNVKPYRYPYFQKQETKKLVEETLTAGLIHHSTSSFPSLVLLLKKKKKTAHGVSESTNPLNSIAINDKFPIPIIDELLDE